MGLALVCLPTDTCPCCGEALSATSFWQPPLFIACDYGHVTQTTVRCCQSCGWFQVTGIATVNPRAFA
jgi:hypothetical protein